jgi:hypothetical protein
MVKLIGDTLNKPHSVFNAHKFVGGYNSISTHILDHIYCILYIIYNAIKLCLRFKQYYKIGNTIYEFYIKQI